MLVWLASYPRSGNTLLRQVLKYCFDLDSCEGLEPVPANFSEPDGIRDEFYGAYFVEGDREEFYSRARGEEKLVLLKSHQLPRDDAKAIYVVRDGRLAVKSFVKFQDTYHPGTSSFEALLLGDHPYGEWSSHFFAWCEARRGETLVVRFEELVNAGEALLARLAAFLGLPAPARPWVNPQAELRRRDPAFFGAGRAEWKPDPFWSETRLRQFYSLHGSLLARLGYATADEVRAGAYPAGSDEERALRFAHQLAFRTTALQVVCDERLEEIARLHSTCGERLEEIHRLTADCDERLAIIRRLDDQAKTRELIRAAVQDQLAAAEAEVRELRRQLHRRPLLFRLLSRLIRR